MPDVLGASSSNADWLDPEIANREQRRQFIPLRRERLAAAFEAVDDRQHALHLQADRFAALDRQQARAAGGDDVFDDDQRLARAKRPFDELARAVLLGFLANHHAAERQALDAGEREDRRGDRVGADRHAADQRRHVAGEQLEHALADEPRALRIERHLAAVEVVASPSCRRRA